MRGAKINLFGSMLCNSAYLIKFIFAKSLSSNIHKQEDGTVFNTLIQDLSGRYVPSLN